MTIPDMEGAGRNIDPAERTQRDSPVRESPQHGSIRRGSPLRGFVGSALRLRGTRARGARGQEGEWDTSPARGGSRTAADTDTAGKSRTAADTDTAGKSRTASKPRTAGKLDTAGKPGTAGGPGNDLASARLTAYRTAMDRLLADPAAAPEEIAVHGSDGSPIRTLAYGPAGAVPLVLSHGWACSARMWNPQVNALAGRFRVICYDQRGHGGTPVGRAPATLDTLADDLSAVLHATVSPERRAVVVGHSMGGMAVAAWAARHPEDVAAFARSAMLASTAVDRLLDDFGVVPFPDKLPGAYAIGRVAMGAPLSAALLPAWGFHRVAMGAEATAAQSEFCRTIVSSCTARNRGRFGAAMSALDVRRGLDALTIPTTVLVGTDDLLTPPVHARGIADHIDAAGHLERYIEIEGAGHMTTVEAPYEVNAQVARLAAL